MLLITFFTIVSFLCAYKIWANKIGEHLLEKLFDNHVDKCDQCYSVLNPHPMMDGMDTVSKFQQMCPDGKLDLLRYHVASGQINAEDSDKAERLYRKEKGRLKK